MTANINFNISTMTYVVDTLAFILMNETTVEGIKREIKNLLIYIERLTHHNTVKDNSNAYENSNTNFDSSEKKKNLKVTTNYDKGSNETATVKSQNRSERQDDEQQNFNLNPEINKSNVIDNENGDVEYDSDETVDANISTNHEYFHHSQTDSRRDSDGNNYKVIGNNSSLENVSNFDKREEQYQDKVRNQLEDIEYHVQTNQESFTVIKHQLTSDRDSYQTEVEAGQTNDSNYYHVLDGTNKGLYKCSVCGKEFERSDTLDKHCWCEHKLKPDLKCKSCNKEFPHRRALRKHKSSECPESAGKIRRCYPCRICQKEFTKKRHAVSHEYLHRGERPFVCELCSKGYRSKDVLRIHMTNMHQDKERHYCEVCGKSFGYKTSLKTHLRQHTDPFSFKCEICGKGYHGKQSLERHMICIHATEKTATCETCGQSFSNQYTLNRHIKSHTETERIICTVCGKNVIARYYKDHMKTHSTERNYKCMQCGKSFRTLNYLKTHKFSHSSERPYKCTECSKSFLTKSKLKVHENIHTGLKPFVCEICGKSSADRSNYYKHKKMHSL